jgi:hypothetical protein
VHERGKNGVNVLIFVSTALHCIVCVCVMCLFELCVRVDVSVFVLFIVVICVVKSGVMWCVCVSYFSLSLYTFFFLSFPFLHAFSIYNFFFLLSTPSLSFALFSIIITSFFHSFFLTFFSFSPSFLSHLFFSSLFFSFHLLIITQRRSSPLFNILVTVPGKAFNNCIKLGWIIGKWNSGIYSPSCFHIENIRKERK